MHDKPAQLRTLLSLLAAVSADPSSHDAWKAAHAHLVLITEGGDREGPTKLARTEHELIQAFKRVAQNSVLHASHAAPEHLARRALRSAWPRGDWVWVSTWHDASRLLFGAFLALPFDVNGDETDGHYLLWWAREAASCMAAQKPWEANGWEVAESIANRRT